MNIFLINNRRTNASVGANTNSEFGLEDLEIVEPNRLKVLLLSVVALQEVKSLFDLLGIAKLCKKFF